VPAGSGTDPEDMEKAWSGRRGGVHGIVRSSVQGVGAAGIGESIGLIGLSAGLAVLPILIAMGAAGGPAWSGLGSFIGELVDWLPLQNSSSGKAPSMSFELILGRRSAQRPAIGFLPRVAPEEGGLIAYAGEGHLMTFAPTGAGKTSGPVICNALRHPGQLIVLDMKGEICAKTARTRRAMGQEVHVLDLRDGAESGSLNPFDLMVRNGTDCAAIARSFAAELIERGFQENDRFWNDWSETMLTAGVTWLLADRPAEARRMSALFDLFAADDVDYHIATLLDEKDCVRHRAARTAFASYLQLPDSTTRPSVLASVLAHLRLFDSDLTRRLTNTSTMDIDALVAGRPMTLYIIVPPPRLTAFRPLLRIWLSGLILAMTQRTVQPKTRTLMLCDEIGNLGRLDVLVTAATLLRSWGLTLWTFWQNVAQLQIYGAQANTLVDNAGVIQIFGVRNRRMAQDFVNLIGGISPEGILSMRPDEQLLLIEGDLLRCRQTRYYNDELFKTPPIAGDTH